MKGVPIGVWLSLALWAITIGIIVMATIADYLDERGGE